MNLKNYELNCIETIKVVYDGYINFDEFTTKRVDCYIQNLFKDDFIKEKNPVLIYVSKQIAEKCTSVKINNNHTIEFSDNEHNILLKTYSDCLEDIVGLENIKGFLID